MLCINPHGAPGCQCEAVLEISWSDTHILLSSLGWFLFFSCLEVHHEGVLSFLFEATLRKLTLTAVSALWSPVCSPQLCSSASLTSGTHVLFHSGAGLKQKTQTYPSQTGGSHHPKECAQLWEATTSRSIPVRASQVHPWKQSMTPVSPWPESCAEERHQHGGFLLQPRSLFFSLCLSSLPRHCLFPLSPVLALDIGISIEACSVVSAQQVSASSWSQVSGAGQIGRSLVTSTGKSCTFSTCGFLPFSVQSFCPCAGLRDAHVLKCLFLVSLLCLGSVLKKLHSLPGYFFPSPSRAEAEKTTQQCCCAGRGSEMLLRMGWVMLSERATPLVDHVGWLQPTLWNAEPQRGCPGDRVTACHS